jgi:hypothetical protein
MIDRRVAILRAQLAAATPGPWLRTGTPERPHWYVASASGVIVHRMVPEPDTVPETLERWTADATLIAASRNALAPLLDVSVAASDALVWILAKGLSEPTPSIPLDHIALLRLRETLAELGKP